ncbi:hypothetical protein OROMI_029962 [Orobanche minor]
MKRYESVSSSFNCFVISILLPQFRITLTNDSNNPTHFTSDNISINCGSIGTSAASNGREWIGDVVKPKSNSFLQIQGSSTTSTSVNNHKVVSADPIPHKTARISRNQFSFAFQVNPGQKILRLHFNSGPYKGFKGLKDLFTVEAGPFVLLGNFSASLTTNALGVSSFSKEFSLNIRENEQFIVTFSPESSSQLIDTYAFINGIEIISVPAGITYFGGGDIGVQVVGEKSPVYVDHHPALDLIHQQNTKQDSVRSGGDSDMGLKIAGSDDVMFRVLVNEMSAQTNIDIVKERDDVNKILWYQDYMVMTRGRRKEGRRDISISLHSYNELIDGQGLLDGFEMFKLSNPDNSLASPNPLPLAQASPSKTTLNLFSVFPLGNAYTFVSVAIISLASIIAHKLREYAEINSSEEENKPSARAERLCRHFSLVGIQFATRKFSDALLIGKGGFGKVYKELIDRGQTTVAMKREMILVCDYMAGGTLSVHLYKLRKDSHNNSSLTWKRRLNICIGAGRGLDYLHTGHGVIHREVKTSNILLDENFVAKVSDFGLAKHEDGSKLQSHVSTRTFVGIAERCLREDPKNRPTMSQVVQQLDVALDQQENKQVLMLNEITSGSDDFHPSINDEKNSVSKGKSPMAYRHVQDPTSSVDKKTNSQAVNAGLPSVRRDVRKATTHKPLRLWPWDTFWNRVKRSKKNDLSSAGMLPTGQLVAVKRLSASFTQGLNEFKNEIHYLLNLQHRNIIKLLGYCIHRDEKLIVYEFMENASLYAFVGGMKCKDVDSSNGKNASKSLWGLLVELLSPSRFRTQSHSQNLKLSNILLDVDMNPKISDFALARTLVENDSELETRIAGTIGYIAPESLYCGKFSVRTDVYSFGIIILEIMSGSRESSWTRMKASYSELMSLCDYAWKVWDERRACDLVDESLEGAFLEEEALRCIQVGLLCT